MIRSAIVASSLVFCVTSSIAAEPVTYTPEVLFPPHTVQLEGQTIDVLGIQIGMGFNAAKTAAMKAIPDSEMTAPNSRFTFQHRGVIVQTPDFINKAEIRRLSKDTKIDEDLKLFFSGPASGNQLIGIQRDTRYMDVLQAPTISDIKKALVQKYGTPSFQRESFGMYKMSWTFTNGAHQICAPEKECSTPGVEYSAQSLGQYMSDTRPVDLGVDVTFHTSSFDKSKISSIMIFLGSTTNKRLAAKADWDSLTKAAEKAWSQASQNVAAPKL